MTKVNELVQFGQNFDFKIRRDHGKNILMSATSMSLLTIAACPGQCLENWRGKIIQAKKD